MRNFSTARKQSNSVRGIIPFIESTCGQVLELFRFRKLLFVCKRNDSVWQKYASLGRGIFFIHGKCFGGERESFRIVRKRVGRLVKVFERAEIDLGNV